jgi:dTDP-4-amino-4,6-dideoxygalactose transaminase
MIPFNRANFDGRELEYLQQAIAGGHVSGNGPFTRQVEDELERRLGGGRVLLTTSCTHALEMAAVLLDLRPGDEVIVPSYTFVTSAGAFLLHGGTPVFVDVDEETLNIDPRAVEAAITERTRAVVAVHYGGVAAALDQLVPLCEANGLMLIEDNAHGLFGTFAGRPLGTFGALATQSFHETKNITCGEGGALVVNDPDLVGRAEILREKGTDRSRFLRGQVDKYTWVDLGSSWVLSDLLSGVLLGQLERVDAIQTRRHVIWDRYAAELRGWAAEHGVRLPHVPQDREHTAHVFFLRLQDIDVRDRFIAHLRERDILAVFHYQPLHMSEMGAKGGRQSGSCRVSEDAGNTLVRLPLYASLSDDEQSQVIDAVLSFDQA